MATPTESESVPVHDASSAPLADAKSATKGDTSKGPPADDPSEATAYKDTCSPPGTDAELDSSKLEIAPTADSADTTVDSPPQQPATMASVSAPTLAETAYGDIFTRLCVPAHCARPMSRAARKKCVLHVTAVNASVVASSFVRIIGTGSRTTFINALSHSTGHNTTFATRHNNRQGFASLSRLTTTTSISTICVNDPGTLRCRRTLTYVTNNGRIVIRGPFYTARTRTLRIFHTTRTTNIITLRTVHPLRSPTFRTVRSTLNRVTPVHHTSLHFNGCSSHCGRVLTKRTAGVFSYGVTSNSLVSVNICTIRPVIRVFNVPSNLADVAALLSPAAQRLARNPVSNYNSVLTDCNKNHVSIRLTRSGVAGSLLPSRVRNRHNAVRVSRLSAPHGIHVSCHNSTMHNSTARTPHRRNRGNHILSLPGSDGAVRCRLASFVATVNNVSGIGRRV